MSTASSPIIVALDNMSRAKAIELSRLLQGSVWGFKVNDLLLECGIEIIHELKRYGNVFADPKLHDIPNTVANGVARLRDAGADFITVHASGGKAMLEAAVKNRGNASLLAVTALTSLSDSDTNEVYQRTTKQTVSALSDLAIQSGINGLVCSAEELSLLSKTSSTLLKIVPGIRPLWYQEKDDQKRTDTPKQALEKGASYLVIGRPITESDDPPNAVKKLHLEIT